MANKEQLAILKQGVAAWNKWREENPDAEVDLRWARLTKIDLSGANFRKADISCANFRESILKGVDFTQAISGYPFVFKLIEYYIIGFIVLIFFIALLHITMYLSLNNETIREVFLSKKYLVLNIFLTEIGGIYFHYRNKDFFIFCFLFIIAMIIFLTFIRFLISFFFHTNFSYSNLTNSIFYNSYLYNAKFKNAIITGVCWHNAKGLQQEKYSTVFPDKEILTWLVDRKLPVNLIGILNCIYINIRNVFFEKMQFKSIVKGYSLKGKKLIGAYFVEASLRGVDLRETDLMQANLSGADITGAKLYGSARENWIIDGIRCDYVYWDEAGEQRTPPDRDFRPGEFEELYKQLPSFEYVFANGFTPLDPLIMDRVVQAVNEQHKEFSLELVNFDKRGQPHATFTVCRLDYVEKARKSVTEIYEKTIEYLMQENEEKNRLIERQNNFIDQLIKKTPSIEDLKQMGDTYNNYGQTGAMGKNASASGNTFQQITADLSRVHEEMQRSAKTPEQRAAAEDVAKAAQAAQQQNEPAVRQHLKNAGKFALDCAQKIGAEALAEYLKKMTLGL